MTSPQSTPHAERRFRIVIGADTFSPDVNGAARFTGRLVDGLAARGHEVHVVCPSTSRGDYTERRGLLTIHRLHSLPVFLRPEFRFCPPWTARESCERLVEAVKPDVVHIQSQFVLGRYLLADAQRGGIPVIATNHVMPDNLVTQQYIPVHLRPVLSWGLVRDLVRVYRRADIVTAPTSAAVQLLMEAGLGRPARAVSCGIDLGVFGRTGRPGTSAGAGGPAIPDASGTGRRPTTILFVGRLDEEKNVGDLIRAIAHLPPSSGVRARIVGDGPHHQRLVALAHDLGVVGRVDFSGFVSDEDLMDAYRTADIFCMPSTAELQSIATLEAMAGGLPVVAADAVALPLLVHDGEDGLLFPPHDVPALAAALDRLAAHPDVRQRMGAASRQIAEHHSLGATLDVFESTYGAAIDAARASSSQREHHPILSTRRRAYGGGGR